MCLRMNNYMYSAGITFIVRLFLLILLLLLALSHVDKLLLIAIFFLILLLRPSLPSFFLSCALPLSLFFLSVVVMSDSRTRSPRVSGSELYVDVVPIQLKEYNLYRNTPNVVT